MLRGGFSPPDPFIVKDFFLFGGVVQTKSRQQTAGLAARSQSYDPTKKTACVITTGQSLATNYVPSAYTVTNFTKVDQMNLFDGGCYETAGQLLGTQDIPGDFGNLAGRLADKLIGIGFDRVIIMCTAIGGATVIDLSSGLLADRVPAGIQRFISRGFVPGNTGLKFIISMWEGETANTTNMSTATHQGGLDLLQANCVAAGFTGSSCRFYLNKETWDGSTVDTNIQASQTSRWGNGFYYEGADMDSLTALVNRQAVGNPHLSDIGADSGTTLLVNKIQASGWP